MACRAEGHSASSVESLNEGGRTKGDSYSRKPPGYQGSLMRCMRHILTKHIIKSGMNRVVFGGLASLMLAGGLALQPAAHGQVVINIAPPAPIVEKVPASRGPNWVWDPGHHQWNGHGRYVWVPGHWIRRPRAGAVWVPGHYDKRGPGWVWISGHWS